MTNSGRTEISLTHIRFYTAIVLFVVMVLVLVPQTTGIPLHEWTSFLLIIPLFVHIIIDWKWILALTGRVLQKQSGRERFNYCWDWLLFIMTTIAMVSGVIISEAALPALGLTMEIDEFWVVAHTVSSNLLMTMLGVHIAMHWKWILNAFNRYAFLAASRKRTTRA